MPKGQEDRTKAENKCCQDIRDQLLCAHVCGLWVNLEAYG